MCHKKAHNTQKKFLAKSFAVLVPFCGELWFGFFRGLTLELLVAKLREY
jgi:hypothetical protein